MIINGFDVTPILEIILRLIIGFASVIITIKVIPCLKARFTNEQLDLIKSIAKVSVKAAEQIYNAGDNKSKFEYAKNSLIKSAASKGIELDEASIVNIIEDAVNDLPKTKQKENLYE